MPGLDPRLQAAHDEDRPRPRPVTASRRQMPATTSKDEPVSEPVRSERLSPILWPALATFALVFGIGVFVFWLMHPGQQPAVSTSPRGIVLPSFAVVAGWVAGLTLLPKLLPRALAWVLLAAGTVFVAVVLSREVTAWLQVVLGSIQL